VQEEELMHMDGVYHGLLLEVNIEENNKNN
jgi:hypothetical protein